MYICKYIFAPTRAYDKAVGDNNTYLFASADIPCLCSGILLCHIINVTHTSRWSHLKCSSYIYTNAFMHIKIQTSYYFCGNSLPTRINIHTSFNINFHFVQY